MAKKRTPNPHSPEEMRRALQQVQTDVGILTEGAAGEILVGAGVGIEPIWTTNLTTLTLLPVDNITINAATIISDTGAISFGDENITTTGSYTGINVTSGNDPGHTHSIYSLVDGTRPFTGTVGGVAPVASSDLTTKAYVDTAVAGAVPQFDAVIDSSGSTGQPVYSLATGHCDLAHADDTAAYVVTGFLIADYSATDTATVQTSGPLTVADWTDATGLATLTSGAQYYLQSGAPVGYITPAYTEAGGTGNRTGSITVTVSNTYGGGSPSELVDGSYADSFWYSAWPASGEWTKWDFGVGVSKLITEAKWYQDDPTSHGTWQWQGSNNDADWTNIGSPFTLGGTTTQTQTELSGNTVGYRYYRQYGISGDWATAPYIREIEFKIADYAGLFDNGVITDTAPSSSGQRVVPVGKAVSTTTLNIEIGIPVLIR